VARADTRVSRRAASVEVTYNARLGALVRQGRRSHRIGIKRVSGGGLPKKIPVGLSTPPESCTSLPRAIRPLTVRFPSPRPVRKISGCHAGRGTALKPRGARVREVDPRRVRHGQCGETPRRRVARSRPLASTRRAPNAGRAERSGAHIDSHELGHTEGTLSGESVRAGRDAAPTHAVTSPFMRGR
jgi:hypothetical protein